MHRRWRKKLAGVLGALVIVLSPTGVFGEEVKQGQAVPFEKKKEDMYYFFYLLYETGRQECIWKLAKTAKFLECIKNASTDNELQACIQEYKKDMKEVKKKVELYSRELVKKLEKRRRR